MSRRRRKPHRAPASPAPVRTAPVRPTPAEADAEAPLPPFNWRAAALWAALTIATLAAYYPAWHGAPLWDDEAHITKPELQSVEGLGRIWFEIGASQQYYPIVHTAFWVMHRLWGDTTLGYHLVNIVLHATSALLIALLLTRLAIPGALLAAFLFALHPVHVESVAWITELKNTLSTVCYLGAALLYLRFDDTREGRDWWRSLGVFLLALGSKTVTATLPAALVVLAWWRHGRISWRRDVRPLAPFFLAAAGAGLLTSWVEYTFIGARGSEFELNLVERVLLAGRAVWFYLSSLVWPSELIFIYPRWTVSAAVAWQYLFPAALAGVFVLFWVLRRVTRAPMAALLVYVIGLGPALGFVNVYPFRYSFVADHFQYQASIAMLTLFAAVLSVAAGRWIRSLPVRAALAVLLIAPLAALTWQNSRQYVNNGTLFQSTVAKNPSAWMAHIMLAAASLQGDHPKPDEALPHLEAAMAANPRSAEVQNAIGLFFQYQGRFAEARKAFEEAVRIAPGLAGPHNNLGVIAHLEGRLEDAARHYRDSLRLDPKDQEARRNLALVMAALGESGAAADELREAVGARSSGPAALEATGRQALSEGHVAEAVTAFEALRRLRPGDAGVRVDLGAAYEAAGRLEEAATEYREAVRLDPQSAEAQDSLGYVLVRQGKFADAIPPLQEAIRLRPNFGPSHASLAGALREVGRLDEAIAAYQRALAFRENATSADVRNNFGIALALRGRTTEATSEFREALRLDPHLTDAQTNLKLLGQP